MATRLFSASKYGQQLFAQAGSRRLTVGTLGESFGLDDNLGAARGMLPDAALRARMEQFIDGL